MIERVIVIRINDDKYPDIYPGLKDLARQHNFGFSTTTEDTSKTC